MKMQNTDMEFVTFDAQDVIATSGPTGGGSMKASVLTIQTYNETYAIGANAGNHLYNQNGDDGGMILGTEHYNKDGWAWYGGGSMEGDNGLFCADKGRNYRNVLPPADEEIETAEGIRDWLIKWGATFQ